MERKVEGLREGSVLVTPEERVEVQGAYDRKLALWRKRKKIYQELWGMVTEAMTENLKDLKVSNVPRIARRYCWHLKPSIVWKLFGLLRSALIKRLEEAI